MNKERMAAFSDGVFAVAITLLVLDLRVPNQQVGAGLPSMLEYLASNLISYVAFLVSFIIIGIKWINHHNMVDELERVDNTLLMLNVLLLLFVCVVPYTTSLLAVYATNSQAPLVALFYASIWSIGGIFFTLFWLYAVRHGLVRATCSTAHVRARIVRYAFGPVGYIVGGLSALFNVYLAILIFLVVAGSYLIPISEPARQSASR